MLNNVLDKFRSTINNASDNLSATVQNIAETNRNKKKLSLLKMMMKSEIKQMDRVYTELGKEYYKQLKKSGRKPADKKQQDLLKNLDDSMAKITYARDCYRAIMESESKASGEDTAEQSAPIEEAEKAVPVAEEKPVSVAPVVEEKPVTTAPVVEEKPLSAAPVVEEKPIAPTVVEEKPVAPPVVEEKPIAPAVVEEKPVAPAVVEEKPVSAAPVVEQKPVTPAVVEEKPVSVAPVVEEKPVSAAPVVEQKPVAPLVVEEKPVAPAVVEEKPISVPPVVEEKPVSAPESKVDGLRGIAAVSVAGIAKETVQSAAVVTEKKMPIADEKKAVSTADTADGKVKKVSKDLETLKRDNRRLREVLMKIAKTMMAVGSADNDKENPDDAS